MEKEVKKGILNKDYSRRQFLEISGKGIAGITMTATLFSLFGCTQKDIDDGNVDIIPTPKGLLVVNRAKCVGCQRCELNCSMNNAGKANPHISRIKMRDNLYVGEIKDGVVPTDYTKGDGIYGLWNFGPTTCRQCKDPACLKACPAKAIYADEKTGARVIDAEKCIGCGACTEACPWNLPTVDPETKKSSKCINCGACAAGCPTGALSIVDWTDVVAAM